MERYSVDINRKNLRYFNWTLESLVLTSTEAGWIQSEITWGLEESLFIGIL